MAPIRRYLRISKYSVLECRIYLDNPALAQSWLLNPRDPVLPRVIASVRPLVLPKLREERERERSRKKSKKRAIKDVVVEDDFEVSIFLTGTDTRHSLLHKQKHFRDKIQTKLISNSSKLTGDTREAAIDVDDAAIQETTGTDDMDVPILSEDQDAIDLADIPAMDETTDSPGPANRSSKRRRRGGVDDGEEQGGAGHDDAEIETIESDSASDDQLFVGQSDSSDNDAEIGPPAKRLKQKAVGTAEEQDEKKKLAMDISYDGFAIYGRVLCLVVKRRGTVGSRGGAALTTNIHQSQTAQPGGQAKMENWIISTQLPEADGAADEDAM
ncbi:hypothetical protein B0H63DRAFT_29594 [Podospora didyma]|uniref:Uncharacterized protein n=1 Tax=Podospora didyma TaxID=330526 RepID=A0AAE0U7G5_9PEZI|nr:hypothetical protein B0H63DRAFT_29594 [Podospora didyma]